MARGAYRSIRKPICGNIVAAKRRILRIIGGQTVPIRHARECVNCLRHHVETRLSPRSWFSLLLYLSLSLSLSALCLSPLSLFRGSPYCSEDAESFVLAAA